MLLFKNSSSTILIFLARHDAGRLDLKRLRDKYNNCQYFSFNEVDASLLKRLVILVSKYKEIRSYNNIVFIHSDPLSLLLKFFLKKNTIGQIVHNTKNHLSRKGVLGILDKIILKLDIYFSKNLFFLDRDVFDSYPENNNKLLISLGVKCGFGKKTKPKKVEVLFFGRYLPYKRVEWVVKAADNFKNVKFSIYSSGFPDLLSKPENCYINRSYISQKMVEQIFSNCHILLLPYESVTQSGPYYMAMENGLSVVAPKLGFFTRNACKNNTYLFEVDSFESFCENISLALEGSLEKCTKCM